MYTCVCKRYGDRVYMHRHVCMSEREREKEKERKKERGREREKERERWEERCMS